jgi:hypothetical protein
MYTLTTGAGIAAACCVGFWYGLRLGVFRADCANGRYGK